MKPLAKKATVVATSALMIVGVGTATADAQSVKSAWRDIQRNCEKVDGWFGPGPGGLECTGITKDLSKSRLRDVAKECAALTPKGQSVAFIYFSYSDGGSDAGFFCGSGLPI